MKLISSAKFCARVILAFGDLHAHKDVFRNYSYFPEYAERRKSNCKIFLEQIRHIVKYSYCNHFYFLYGFDIEGLHDEANYVDNGIFMKQRNLMNNRAGYSHVAILRDKSLFDIVACKFGFRTPEVLGLIDEDIQMHEYSTGLVQSFTEYLMHHDTDAYLKVVDGECADGVFHIIVKNGMVNRSGKCYTAEEYVESLPKRTRFILQCKLPNQHPAIHAIFANAVNTIRLVTVMNPATGRPEVFTAVLRVGVGQNEVDNWAAGGLSIGIDTNKLELRKYGFYKPGYGTKATEHPDSHIEFEGYKIPFMKEALDEALRFHKMIPGIHSIGWDIAITEEGPCFIEGNDNWEISLMQISNHGLQSDFDRLFYPKK